MSEEVEPKEEQKIQNQSEEVPENLILVMGLDDAGKTSLFNHYFDGLLFHPLPTELVEETKREFYGLKLLFREIGGRYRYRPEWYDNINNAKGIIWVVDSIDRGRKTESKEELDALLQQKSLPNLPLLFIANKQESKYVMPWEEIVEKFKFDELGKERKLNIVRTTHYTCENLTEGLLWLVEEMGLQPVFADENEKEEKEEKEENEIEIPKTPAMERQEFFEMMKNLKF